MLRTGDLGLLPEYELHKRAKDSTPYETATDPKLNPLSRLLEIAWVANHREVQRDKQALTLAVQKLVLAQQDDDAAIRWWGHLGFEMSGNDYALTDASPLVRVAKAEHLYCHHQDEQALAILTKALSDESPFIRLAALNVLERMGAKAVPAIPAIEKATMKSDEAPDAAEYVGRMVGYLPDRIRAAAAKGN
jgi:hypothetical protein